MLLGSDLKMNMVVKQKTTWKGRPADRKRRGGPGAVVPANCHMSRPAYVSDRGCTSLLTL